MHRSTYCNITSSNIISYIQMLTNPWDSTVPGVRPYVRYGIDTHFQFCIPTSPHDNTQTIPPTVGTHPRCVRRGVHPTYFLSRSDIKKASKDFSFEALRGQ